MRMQAWQHLACDTLSSEFPDFNVCNAFAVCSLPASLEDGGQTPPHTEKHCQNIAKALGVDATVLQHELGYLRVSAIRHKGNGVNNGQAWEAAVAEFKKRQHYLKNAPACDTLIHCLMRYRAYAISTCGLERKFSKQVWTTRTQSMHQGIGMASVKAKLTNDYDPKEETTVILCAQELWVGTFGGCRETRGKRSHAGRPQPRNPERHTESAFLGKRRAAVRAAAGQANSYTQPNRGPDPLVWGVTHQKERSYQAAKRRTIQIESYHCNTLLPSEQDGALPAEAAASYLRNRNNALAAHRKSQRKDAQDKMTLLDFMHTPRSVFVDNDVSAGALTSLRRKLTSATFTQRRCGAELFVAADPAKPGSRTEWATRLLGGWVTSVLTLIRPTMVGGAIKWDRALKTKRCVYWTPGYLLR